MKTLFHRLKDLGLPKGKYAIFGSGPLLVRGLIQPHDLDIIVTKDVFEESQERPGWILKKAPSGSPYLDAGIKIELWRDWRPGIWDIGKLIREAETIDGLPFVSLESVLVWKKLHGRTKDQKHIKLINEYLKKKGLS